MAIYDYNIPTRVIFGIDAINRLIALLGDYGRKVLIVADSFVKEGDLIDKLSSIVKETTDKIIVFDDVTTDSRTEAADEAVRLARDSRADVVIGVGGFNTTNIAKIAATLARVEGFISDYLVSGKKVKKQISYIEVPTSNIPPVGLTDAMYIIDEVDGYKKEYVGEGSYADLLIVDPNLALSLPANYTTVLAIESLAISIEAYISKAANYFSDNFAIRAMEIVYNNTPKFISDTKNIKLKESLSLGALYSGFARALSKPGTCFALSQALHSTNRLYHAISMTILLPHIMEFNMTSSATKYVQIAKSLGEDVSDITIIEAAIKAVEAIRKLYHTLKVPHRLSEFGISEDEVEKIALRSTQFPFLSYLPRPVSHDEIVTILTAAL